MSLIKQLWIATLCVTLLALGGSLVVGTLSARDYLVEALTVKNLDDARGLALVLTHLPKDPVSVELQLAARMDTGHYRSIRLLDPEGAALAELHSDAAGGGAPEWLPALVPMQAPAGLAQVQDGWHQFGTVSVQSHDRYAYESLWDSMLDLLLWFVVGGVACGLLGTLLLRRILRPLGEVVAQAEAIGERRFVLTSEPGTQEFATVVAAMNRMSGRVRQMLGEEAARLEALRHQTQHDELTGLMNRAQFLRRLETTLADTDSHAGGTLVIGRLGELADLNRRCGRPAVDGLLRALGKHFAALAQAHPGWEAGRLNGADFALLAVGEDDAAAVVRQVREGLDAALASAAPATAKLPLPVGACAFAPGCTAKALLVRTDGALAAAEQEGERAVRIADPHRPPLAHADLDGWRTAIEAALATDRLQLARFPVLAGDGSLMHHEAPVRIHMDGEWQSAGYFMPWAARLGLMGRIDAAVVERALAAIQAGEAAQGINLSAESLCDAGFRTRLEVLLAAHPEGARALWVEVPEYGVVQHPAEFRELCGVLRPLGCRIGIEHFGCRFDRIGDLHELGLDYVKVDASLVRGIDNETGNQGVLRSLCVLAHGLGIRVIAEGVESAAERATLVALGADGMTGPGVRALG